MRGREGKANRTVYIYTHMYIHVHFSYVHCTLMIVPVLLQVSKICKMLFGIGLSIARFACILCIILNFFGQPSKLEIMGLKFCSVFPPSLPPSIGLSPVYSSSRVPMPLIPATTIDVKVIFFCPTRDFSFSKKL